MTPSGTVGSGSASGCSEQAIVAPGSTGRGCSGPTTASTSSAAAGRTAQPQPACHAATGQTRLTQWPGWSSASSPAIQPDSTPRVSSRLAVLSTQLANDVALNSVRAPLARSYQVSSGRLPARATRSASRPARVGTRPW